MDLPVSVVGKVTHGAQLGRKFDMPTANIEPDKEAAKLPFGVYYSEVCVDGRTYKAISNLGKKPTVKETDSVNLETFLYDFDGDLYGKELTVVLLEFKRPEMKFESVEKLVEQVHTDINAGRDYCKKS